MFFIELSQYHDSSCNGLTWLIRIFFLIFFNLFFLISYLNIGLIKN